MEVDAGGEVVVAGQGKTLLKQTAVWDAIGVMLVVCVLDIIVLVELDGVNVVVLHCGTKQDVLTGDVVDRVMLKLLDDVAVLNDVTLEIDESNAVVVVDMLVDVEVVTVVLVVVVLVPGQSLSCQQPMYQVYPYKTYAGRAMPTRGQENRLPSMPGCL